MARNVVSRPRQLWLAAAVFLLVSPACGRAAEPGYNMWFAGRILSVDRGRGILRIARGPTETAAAAYETCTIERSLLDRVRRGMDIEAQADTHRRPWRILHMRIFERKLRPKPTAAINA